MLKTLLTHQERRELKQHEVLLTTAVAIACKTIDQLVEKVKV